MKYKAFISYKHHLGLPFSMRLASEPRSYAKPLLKPPLNIFRDEDHLVPDNDLPLLIRNALEKSEFLILLASKAASESSWVRDELKIWCQELERADQLIFVLINDRIDIDQETKRINWTNTTALPRDILEEQIDSVPLYIDLTWVERREQLDIQDPRTLTSKARSTLSQHDFGVKIRLISWWKRSFNIGRRFVFEILL